MIERGKERRHGYGKGIKSLIHDKYKNIIKNRRTMFDRRAENNPDLQRIKELFDEVHRLTSVNYQISEDLRFAKTVKRTAEELKQFITNAKLGEHMSEYIYVSLDEAQAIIEFLTKEGE
jgi:hypothetical protein